MAFSVTKKAPTHRLEAHKHKMKNNQIESSIVIFVCMCHFIFFFSLSLSRVLHEDQPRWVHGGTTQRREQGKAAWA